MRYDLHVRRDVQEQIQSLATRMSQWETQPAISDDERAAICSKIQLFSHNTKPENYSVAGVDGSGDFPSVSYSDSFVYVTVAHATVYETAAGPTLKERSPAFPPVIDFAWIPEDETQRREAWDRAFASLAGRSVEDVLRSSDYLKLNTALTGKQTSIDSVVEELLRPHAADTGNIAIQLRTLGELGAALRLLESSTKTNYVLIDTTLSLPMVAKRNVSLFYEHLKRLCCVVARDKGVGFLAISKSHGLPSMELIESLAKEKSGTESTTEHWYIRLPVPNIDSWTLNLLHDRPVPPVGAVSYLVRFHKNVPVLRVDMDVEFWLHEIRGETDDETHRNERKVFEDLDFACHDQRAFGYPYPLKAGHDRASLTNSERVALKKQIIDAAVAAGMRRSVFRDASIATGHK